MVAVEVDGLRKVYGDLVAVDDPSFTIQEGEAFSAPDVDFRETAPGDQPADLADPLATSRR